MRHSRSKAYRKLMAMYSTSFGFRQPYQVLGACISQSARFWQTSLHLITSSYMFHNLVDSEMCETIVSQKIDFITRIESVLLGSVKLSE